MGTSNTTIKEYEREIISILLTESGIQNVEIPTTQEEIQIDHTGVGYFLTFASEKLPIERTVLNKPNISGHLGGTPVGFLAFVENAMFTLECHTYEDSISPEDREREYKAESW